MEITNKMAQFEVVKAVYESERPIKREEIISKFDLHSSTVRVGITDCISKGYIRETSEGLEIADGFDDEKLESIRPRTIDEMKE